MQQEAWEEIERIYTLPGVDPKTIEQFKQLKTSQATHARGEGNSIHYCSFFLPYDKQAGKIYLGYHIKADDWIPPGGHIEPGETPKDAAVREMMEELQTIITKDQLIPFNLSVKAINRPDKGCITHYDIWHLVDVKVQAFDYLKSEYHDAGWFSVSEGVKKITKNLDFAQIVGSITATLDIAK
jgi:8-oxo-dGTP pyrophosphatase MutT (NUDIX family)